MTSYTLCDRFSLDLLQFRNLLYSASPAQRSQTCSVKPRTDSNTYFYLLDGVLGLRFLPPGGPKWALKCRGNEGVTKHS